MAVPTTRPGPGMGDDARLLAVLTLLLIALRFVPLLAMLVQSGCAAESIGPTAPIDGRLDPGPRLMPPSDAGSMAADTPQTGGDPAGPPADVPILEPPTPTDLPSVPLTDPVRDARPDPAPVSDAATDLAPDPLPGPACPEPGGLVIAEILIDPIQVADTLGEYVEVYNPTEVAIDLRGWEIRSQAKRHQIPADVPLIVEPGGRIVLGASADPQVNGGFHANHAWQGLRLGNQAGDVSLWCGNASIDHVAWSAEAWPLRPGRAIVLDPDWLDAAANDDPAFWCGAEAPFGQGDLGSPGQADRRCLSRSCGDGTHQVWEDCEDGNTLSGDGCSRTCRLETFAPGMIVITEFHHTPDAAGSAGEFIELHNPTAATVDVAGWVLSDDRTDRVRIQPESGSLPIAPGGYAVLARSGDPARNGGFLADWVYADRFVMTSPEDRIVLTWNGGVIDQVHYHIGTDDWPQGKGRSLNLDATCIDDELNDCGAFWCPTRPEHRLPGGDAATPGLPNHPCP